MRSRRQEKNTKETGRERDEKQRRSSIEAREKGNARKAGYKQKQKQKDPAQNA